ncbi:uncharacterized protein BO96DRAFT_187270 [Aspergillus niger CBS 101883]|uniref:uncharacterized protein n=1 Tax=Aspergillus lacticoffeatus (strain CBS 101883) TaxID=1450533 RepID=UPI000D7FA199|nr:uncharacterized protein BO96DRAFT_187270 [Aspergillus niger CBS 101883]PYH51650.1 hypothetical protein BO96DRAFT_187270 [Aspergillus niger CBS 101883]
MTMNGKAKLPHTVGVLVIDPAEFYNDRQTDNTRNSMQGTMEQSVGPTVYRTGPSSSISLSGNRGIGKQKNENEVA